VRVRAVLAPSRSEDNDGVIVAAGSVGRGVAGSTPVEAFVAAAVVAATLLAVLACAVAAIVMYVASAMHKVSAVSVARVPRAASVR
jgi:hypothetical protein